MSQFDIGKWKRNLPFPLLDSEYPEEQVPTSASALNVNADFFPDGEPDELIDLHFRMSMSQFTAIASAIDIGRDIGFGEQSFELWRTWCKALIGVISSMSCEDIADCIETDETTQNAIADAITINELIQNAVIEQLGGLGNTNRVNATRTTIPDRNAPQSLEEDIKELASCNLDALWAGIREMVQRIDDTSRDLLEDLATYNDLPQRYQAFIDVVPVLGDVAEGIATAATELIPDILNAYNSHSSESVLDEIACDLFSLVCAECRYPTFEELYNYYATLGFEMSDMDAMTTTLLVSKLSLMMVGVPSASIVYFSVCTFNLFVLYIQATFNGVSGTNTLTKWARLGEDFANNNWRDLCETCAEQYAYVEWDLTTGMHGWYPDSADASSPVDDGVHVMGKGWMATVFSTGQRAELAHAWDATWRVRAVMWKSNTLSGLSGRGWWWRPTAGTLTGQTVSTINTPVSGEWNNCRDSLLALTGYEEVAIALQFSTQSPARYVEKIRVIFDAEYAPVGAIPIADATPC